MIISVARIELFGEADEADIKIIGVDIKCILVEESIGLASQPAFSITWSAIVDTLLIRCGVHKVNPDVVKQNIIDLARNVASDEDAVLRCGKNIYEADIVNWSASAFCGSLGKTPACILMVANCARVRSDIDWF